MKIRKSEAYLVISSVYLGADQDILNIYKQVAKFYKAQVIHLGPTASTKEINLHKKLSKDIAGIEQRLDYLEGPNQVRAESALEMRKSQLGEIEALEEDRIAGLIDTFGKMQFVTTPDLCLNQNFTKAYNQKAEHIHHGLELSKYLFLSPIPPSGERTTRSPITAISLDFLKSLGRSWIVPHPVPIVECFPRPGLNEAHSYYTAGALKHSERPTSTRDQYKFAHMPCAVLVILDKANGEFHPKQLHIDYLVGKNSPTETHSEPVVLDDGLVFSEKGWKEVGSPDKACLGTDAHVPYTHAGWLGALRAINAKHKPETFIDNGDAGDFDPISHHNEHKPGERENKRLIDTLRGLRSYYDAATSCPSIKNKISIDSNHHEWVTDFVMKNPSLIGMLDWATLATDWFSDWKVLIRQAGEPEIYKFGDMVVRHGDVDGGVRKADKTFGKYVCGHYHRYAAYRRAVMVGCGAKLGPRYISGQINAWQNQVATMTKFKEVAAINAKVVLHDNALKVSRVAYRNEILEVDFYELFKKSMA